MWRCCRTRNERWNFVLFLMHFCWPIYNLADTACPNSHFFSKIQAGIEAKRHIIWKYNLNLMWSVPGFSPELKLSPFKLSNENVLQSVQVMACLHTFPIFSFLAKMLSSRNDNIFARKICKLTITWTYFREAFYKLKYA